MENNNRNKQNIIGIICALVANIFLCCSKFVVGLIFSSISLTADAANNLSDAGNNVVSLVSAKISEKPADKEHPFGYQRVEYIAGTVVGFVVLFMCVELALESINKIILNFKEPYLPEFDVYMVVVLCVAIVVKIGMYFILKKSDKKYNLPIHKAMAIDSISDVIASSAILVSVLVGYFAKINLDGYMGLVVSIIIFVAGVKIILVTLNSLIGIAPSENVASEIKNKIMSYENVLGVHDLIIHDYGPQKKFVTAHAEVDSKLQILDAHEMADKIERDFFEKDKIELLIHLDPIVTDDQYTNDLKHLVCQELQKCCGEADIHDFRVVYGSKHRVLFDLVLPYGNSVTASELASRLTQAINDDIDYCITIDNK